MNTSYRKVLFLVLISFWILPLQSQNYVFPNGAKIAFLSDINNWLSVCEDCQDINNPAVRLTVTSNNPGKSRPDKASVWTVEYQDGKYRFKSAYNTYMRICFDCRKNNPKGPLVVADAGLNRYGKVSGDALFDIISIANSPYYQIVSYQGNYITRNYSAADLKGRSHILMAFYDLPCRASSKFKIIELQEQAQELSIEHADLSDIGWLSTLQGDGFNRYLAKDISSDKVFVPGDQDLYRQSSNFGIRYFEGAYYIGYASDGKKADSYVYFNSNDSSLKLRKLTGSMSLKWNLLKLGITKNLLGQKKTVFFIKSILADNYIEADGDRLKTVNFTEAGIFMFEKNPYGLQGKRPDMKFNYEEWMIPGTDMTIINPNSLPKTNFYWTQKIYMDKKFTYNSATWRLATLPEIQKIHKALDDKGCYLDLDGQYYYVKDNGKEFYIHPHYMAMIKGNKVVFSSYKDKTTRRNVFLVKE